MPLKNVIPNKLFKQKLSRSNFDKVQEELKNKPFVMAIDSIVNKFNGELIFHKDGSFTLKILDQSIPFDMSYAVSVKAYYSFKENFINEQQARYIKRRVLRNQIKSQSS